MRRYPVPVSVPVNVVRWLQKVTEDEMTLSTTHPVDKSTLKTYPWFSVEDVQRL